MKLITQPKFHKSFIEIYLKIHCSYTLCALRWQSPCQRGRLPVVVERCSSNSNRAAAIEVRRVWWLSSNGNWMELVSLKAYADDTLTTPEDAPCCVLCCRSHTHFHAHSQHTTHTCDGWQRMRERAGAHISLPPNTSFVNILTSQLFAIKVKYINCHASKECLIKNFDSTAISIPDSTV